ncbi:GGDEF domain-containing protein, partial [Patulibacter sp. NPDC049589]|uniref:GGDEF domain-containing protein n=1 Tax=Patulibacter sp. NPDC049589 TaxID=3154731 RepID=UPI0034258C4B
MSVPALPTDAPSLEALRSAVDAMDEHVTLLARDGRLLHVNRARRSSEAVEARGGLRFGIGSDPLAAADVRDPQSRAIAAGIRSVLAGERERFEVEYSRRSDRSPRWFALRASAIAVDGVGAVVVHTDVTARRLAERASDHRADHDGLTGLANRRLLEQRLEELLVGGPVGVIVLRLHGDDPRNAVRLSGDGEEILRETAELVGQLVGEGAVTGRHGADRFVVLLPGVDDAGLDGEGARVRLPLLLALGEGVRLLAELQLAEL